MVRSSRAAALVLALVGSVVLTGVSSAAADTPLGCGVSLQTGKILIEIDDDSDGQWAANLRGENGQYVFLGRHNSTSLSLDIPDGLADGTWRVQARGIRTNGQKTARVTCGDIYLVPQFSCWANVIPDISDFSVNVLSRQPFDSASINFRDTSWIERQVPANTTTIFNSKTSRLATSVVIRQKGQRFDVPCTSALTGGISINDEPGVTTIRIQEVLKSQVIYELGDLYVQNGVLDLRTNVAQEVGSLSQEFNDFERVCDDRAIVFTNDLTMDTFPGPGAIDAETGDLFVPGNFFYDELIVDCAAGILTAIDTDQGEPDKIFKFG